MKEDKNPIYTVKSIDEELAKLQIKKGLELEKALKSGNVNNIYSAQAYLKSIQPKGPEKPQSLILDPQQYGHDGYKEKTYNLSYQMLRAMSRTSIVKPIIKTRTDQVLDFMTPQKDKHSKGFVIRPKKAKLVDGTVKLTKEEENEIEYLTEFLLNCGDNANAWHGDDLDSFIKKIIPDALGLDQSTFELIENRAGELTEFLATDGSTYRIADSHDDEYASSALQKGEKYGYLPYYVQVYQSRIVAEFYPWELCFGIRNPQTDMYANGYGRSELEDLIENVTSTLNTEQYNSNYFKVGSNPKGFLRVTGNVNNNRIEEFRNQWQATMAGVRNAHKLAILEAEKMDFISTQSSNKDMEYVKYFEFLIKFSCAHYTIDPSEIGFPMNGSSENQGGLGGNSGMKERLKHSQTKGLNPLLKTIQTWFNKYIINRKNPKYEFIIEGMEIEDPQTEFDNDVKGVANWMTVNEVRRKRGMKDIEGGDIILNPIFIQQQMMEQEQSNQAMEENPFNKALEEDIQRIFTEDSINV